VVQRRSRYLQVEVDTLPVRDAHPLPSHVGPTVFELVAIIFADLSPWQRPIKSFSQSVQRAVCTPQHWVASPRHKF
jgi:hypothetical protein